MLPYAEITESADRRWTFRLLDRLTAPGLPSDERGDLVEALVAVSDRRSVPILERVLTDRSQKDEVRESAGAVLRGMQDLDVDWPENVLRSWWAGADPILCRHALLCMGSGCCPDIVRAVAADPAHSLRATALGRMTFFFDAPADLRLKIDALTDPDPTVRETTAAILFWDEPVAAEEALVVATADAVEGVAVEAIRTLEYYPSVRVIRALHGLLDHVSERVRDTARGSWEAIRSECLLHLHDDNSRVSARIRHWLTPVWELLSYYPEELNPPAEKPHTPSPGRETSPPPLSDLLRLLADPDTSPQILREVLWASVWSEFPVADQRRLRPVLLNHPDPLVRERGTAPFQTWADVDALLALVDDPDFGVRKSAMYRLGRLPPNERIADIAWEHFLQLRVFGVHATETLGTFVTHASRAAAIPKLLAIATTPSRAEPLRVDAVRHLAGLETSDAVRSLAGFLTEPPAVTWALHIAVLEGLTDFGIAADVSCLEAVDNVFVQATVAKAIGANSSS